MNIEGTIDLHCHLLPGIDDGARDLDDAVAMARQAQADGVAAICATPHIRADHAVLVAELPARRAELETALRAAGCSTHVLAGGEVASDMLDRLDDHELASLSLGGSGRWILLEPPAGPLDLRIEQAVDALHARGFRALVAHPERHMAPALANRLSRLSSRGALIQATAASFTDEATRPAMLDLARSGVIHVLGSDSHSSRAGRRTELSPALKVLCDLYPTASQLEWVAHRAPRAIVRGDDFISPLHDLSEERAVG